MGTSGPSREVPLILKGSDGRRRIVTAADDLALQMGVYVGMPVAKAEALFSDLVILEADPKADAAALQKLAVWGLRHYSPNVAADPPDGLVLDIQGAAHLFGGEAGLIDDMRCRLSDLGITGIVAVAETWGSAHALARFGGQPVQIVETGKAGQALRRLPVEALRLPPEMLPDLHLLGLDTIGELAAKPRPPLAKAFGNKLFRRIDQAFGRLAEPIEPVDAPELIKIERIFAEPIGAPETIEKYTRRLVGQMCERLEEHGLGVRRLDLHYTRTDNKVETIFVATAKPVREPKRLSKLLCDKIETVDPGWGIDKMVMTAAFTEPLIIKQVLAPFEAPARPDMDELCDGLTNRYGEASVYRAIPVATDIPERSVKRVSPASTLTGSDRNALYRRPQRIYHKPEPIMAMAVMPDYPPRAFTWRGQRYAVACADGPERVQGEWWVNPREKGKVRDYFILEVDSGERLWVFRTGDGVHGNTGSLAWYIHGKFE
ncbi:Protein ImuB (plasmid) [Asticcacaulis sp. MM231]|uniref:Y-family DNA polymerase n=1 Tax=Asticcacaulis sp. MM231 TaxID=3157666 RepID=UPI0032D5A3AD